MLRQSALQPSPLIVLPSSQTSPGSSTPLPQTYCEVQGPPIGGQVHPGSTWQRPLQPSPGSVLPSSHCSLGWLTLPSPQAGPDGTSMQFLGGLGTAHGFASGLPASEMWRPPSSPPRPLVVLLEGAPPLALPMVPLPLAAPPPPSPF